MVFFVSFCTPGKAATGANRRSRIHLGGKAILDVVLADFEADQPSGADLEYDAVFTELEIAAQPGEERQTGKDIIPGRDPDYKVVVARASDILSRSHDLRAAVFLAEAELILNGFAGFAPVTTYIATLLTEYWDTCHPRLDDEDDDDPTMRINAVSGLVGDPDGTGTASRVYDAVRRAPLTRSRAFGAMSLRHLAVASGEIAAPADMDSVPDAARIVAAFQDTDADALREIAAAVTTVRRDLEAIDAAFDARTPGRGPKLEPLLRLMRLAEARIVTALGGDAKIEARDDGAASPGPAGDGAAAPSVAGVIGSPADVRTALDRIVAYYERSEPSSPVPVILNRARRLVGADFLSIVRDMAPNGIENVNLIGGIGDDED